MAKRFYHSVRFKLLLVSLTLLGIPWAGYRFILETEQFLRDAQQQNLQGTAYALASLAAQQVEQFSGSRLPGQPNRQRNLFLHDWSRAPVIDGYADDWESFSNNFSEYRLPGGELRTRVALGTHGKYAYLLLHVADTSRDYGETGDQVELAFARGELLTRLRIHPRAPGWVIAQRVRRFDQLAEPAVRGEWQETADGYVLELRLPRQLLGERIAIAAYDSASGNRLQTARLFPAAKLGRLVSHSQPLDELLAQLTPAATRSWLVDHEGLVLASAGHIDEQGPLSADEERLPWLVQQLILTVLPHQADAEFAIPTTSSRLLMPPLSEALEGRPAGLRRRIPQGDAIVASAAVPVRGPQGVMGAVLIEQTTNAILSIQNLALQRLFAVTLIFFVVTSLGLLLFASLLTSRIRRLRNQFDSAVSHDGRIIGEVRPGRSPDEIGELERGLGGVLARLGEYNNYLEAMASRLAHELRTPLSVVRTSLDNASLSTDSKSRHRYIDRAQGGAQRLELILKRLREATRLEQSLQQAEFETFDLVELLRHQAEAFHAVWPEINIDLHCEGVITRVTAVPDLLSQALEKLMSNAVDFHQPGSRIRIELHIGRSGLDLAVANQGPPLPEGLDLFKSMVSGRTGRADQPHLGLGLYLVRLIAEFHRGSAYAETVADQTGVRVGLRLPVLTAG